jgi:type VI secretion system protein ImpJ
LGECFTKLLSSIQETLTRFTQQEAVAIEIHNHQQGRYLATIKDARLLQAQVQFILAVKAETPAETVRNRFPLQVKLGPLERLREIVNLQLPGLTLQPLVTAPRQLPLHQGFVYFGLDTQHPLWQHLEHSAGLGIYITGDYPNIELALWAIQN